VTFESDYVNLLIKQYWEKPSAAAEIAMKAGMWRRTFEWIDSFSDEFDLDNATGDRLDIIGRIVGIGRNIPYSIPKIAFGFDENPNSRGFDDLFHHLTIAPRFRIYLNLRQQNWFLMTMRTGNSFEPRLQKTRSVPTFLTTIFCQFKTRLLLFLADWPTLQIIMT
jgi:Protein of unknown function (DUF2612).